MPMIEGTTRPKTWTGDYAFAVQGGAVSTITLTSNDGEIPNGSVIMGGVLDVTTIAASSGSATIAITVNAANDIVSATAFDGAPFSTTGVKDIIPDSTGSTAIKCTAARNPKVVIAAAALTAGVFRLILTYK